MVWTHRKFTLLSATLMLGACGSNDTGSSAGAVRTRIAAQSGSDRAPMPTAKSKEDAAIGAKLLAAAEPFEGLTETAFDVAPARLDTSISACDKALRGVQTILPRNVLAKLEDLMLTVQTARAANQRADIALASIEAYRALISAVPGTPSVPINVGLLDYAGFRYNADAQANPPRWDDMALSVVFARERWASIAPLGPVASLTTKYEAALTSMDRAIGKQDVAQAKSAARVELDLVDALESAFEHTGHSKN
jgi:hypothetical protein